MNIKVLKKVLQFIFIFLLAGGFANAKKNKNQNIKKMSVPGVAEAVASAAEMSDAINEEGLSAEEQWQRIEWEDSKKEFVLYYEIEIQEYIIESKKFQDKITIKTEDNTDFIHINPQLEPGSYRYRIIPYNLLGLRGKESDWLSFIIVEAYQPVISSFTANSSKSETIYLDEWNDGRFSVGGRNLFEGKENEIDTKYTDYALISRKKSKNSYVEPEKIEHKNDRNLEVYYDIKQLDVGTYDFVATDASGLESERGNHSVLNVKYRKWMDFDISGGYVIPVVLMDETIPKYMDSNVWPVSAYGRLSILPIKHSFGNIGLGLYGSFTRMNAEFDRYYIDGNMITGFANLIYQLPVYFNRKDPEKRRHRLTFELHGGVGAVYLMDFQFHFGNGIESKKLNSIILGSDAGLSTQVYITNRLFIEANVDGVLAFGKDMTLGMLLPSVGAGWQF